MCTGINYPVSRSMRMAGWSPTQSMSHASCVLIIAGVYASYSKWIDIEIKLAQEMNKPVLAIRPWAAKAISDHVRGAVTK